LVHWYVSGAVPDAVTLNVALRPATIVCDCGCALMLGAIGAGFTVSNTPLLTASGDVPFDTVTE
jgi:hypothetical protein